MSTPIYREASRIGHILNFLDIEEHEEAVLIIPKILKDQVKSKEVPEKIDTPRRRLSKRLPTAKVATTTEVHLSRSASQNSQSSTPEGYTAARVTPLILFKHETEKLFTGIRDPKELLVYATGACDNNSP